MPLAWWQEPWSLFLTIILPYVIGYWLATLVVLQRCRGHRSAVALSILPPLGAMLPMGWPWGLAALLILACTMLALSHSLVLFHERSLQDQIYSGDDHPHLARCWPWAILAADVRRYDRLDQRWLLLLLVPWILAGGMLANRLDDKLGPLAGFALFLIPGIALVDVVSWTKQHRPALGLVARLASGQLIQPAYDRIFVPVAAAMVCLFATIGLHFTVPAMHHNLTITGGICVALVVYVLLRPDRQTWLLTAPVRLVQGKEPPPQSQDPGQILRYFDRSTPTPRADPAPTRAPWPGGR